MPRALGGRLGMAFQLMQRVSVSACGFCLGGGRRGCGHARLI